MASSVRTRPLIETKIEISKNCEMASLRFKVPPLVHIEKIGKKILF
jgi:hypothetical protein